MNVQELVNKEWLNLDWRDSNNLRRFAVACCEALLKQIQKEAYEKMLNECSGDRVTQYRHFLEVFDSFSLAHEEKKEVNRKIETCNRQVTSKPASEGEGSIGQEPKTEPKPNYDIIKQFPIKKSKVKEFKCKWVRA